MPLSQAEFDALIDDPSKRIIGDLTWEEDEDHSPALEFRADIESDAGYPLFVKASFNPLARTMSVAIVHRGAGRIYALDLGKDHRNPNGEHTGDKHKHRWREPHRDRWAYVPDDIVATVEDPVEVWVQFCREAKIAHQGLLHSPPPMQEKLFL